MYTWYLSWELKGPQKFENWSWKSVELKQKFHFFKRFSALISPFNSQDRQHTYTAFFHSRVKWYLNLNFNKFAIRKFEELLFLLQIFEVITLKMGTMSMRHFFLVVVGRIQIRDFSDLLWNTLYNIRKKQKIRTFTFWSGILNFKNYIFEINSTGCLKKYKIKISSNWKSITARFSYFKNRRLPK